MVHFINSAYIACINKRIGILDERYIPQDKRIQQPQPTPMPSSMRILMDFGLLYKNEMLGKVTPTMNSVPLETGGDRSIIFNLALMDSQVSPPYVVNVTLVEVSEADKKVVKARYMCKPLTVTDAPRYALMYQENKYLPYVYYRVKPYRSGTTKTSENHMGIEVCTPVEANPTWKADNFYLNVDYIEFPTPWDEANFADDSKTKVQFLPVMFGYEIAMEAAKIAMESLGNARATSLSTLAQQQMGANATS